MTHPPREERKTARQSAILDAVSNEKITTQNDLVLALRRRGVAATQVSISRDVAELGLIKIAGVYHPGSAENGASDPEMPLRTFVRSAAAAGPHLTVVRCDVGAAPRVGLALDGLKRPGLVGTLAGDDTVFVASESEDAQQRLLEFLNSRMPRP